MVAIVAGNGLGLFNTSLNTLGGGGVIGQGGLGQAGGQGFVNISNGNLILQFNDKQLSGLGQDLYHLRTYNAQGTITDTDGDGWRWDGERKVKHTGILNASGSQITRTTGDGHEAVYAWNGSRYQSTEGDGAHDSIEAATVLWILPTEWVWKDGSTGVEERYDLISGRLKSVKDTSGNTISYSYDISGRLTSVKDSSGQEMIYAYNGDGQLKRLDTKTASNGALTRQVYYLYDEVGRLLSVTTDLTPSDGIFPDENAYTTSYTYDGSSFRIASVTQSDGTSVAYTYELVGSEYRVKTVADATGTTTFTYDTTNRRTDVSNGLGQVWSYHYDTTGQLIQVQTPTTGGVRLSTSYAYDAQGNVTSVTDGAGSTISYSYDTNGNRTLERDALGNTVRYVYDSANQLQNEIRYTVPATLSGGVWTNPPDSAAQTTRYVYDSKSNLRYAVDATGVVTEYRYSGTGLRLAEVSYGDALYGVGSLTPTATLTEATLNTWAAARDKTRSQLTERTYDYRGNLTKVTTHASVNSSGAGVVNTATQIIEYVYSEHGQLLQTIAVRGTNRDARTTLSSTTYDGLGRVLSQIDALGTRTTVYNGASRQIAVTNSAGMTTTQTYDTRGRLVSIGQAASGETTRTSQYVYDAAGRLTMAQDPTGVRTYTFYDEAGRVSARVDGTGAVVEYVYNGAGQLTQEKGYANPANTAGWYTGGVVTKTLVSQIRPTLKPAEDRVISHAYDSAGRRSSTTDGGGTVTTYGYDGRGQLVKVQTGDRVTRTFYDAAGRQAGQLDGEGYLRESIYNAAGQLQQVIRYAALTPAAQRESGTLAQLRPSTTGALSTWYYYDNAGRQVGSVDEQGFVTETVFNEAANTLRSTRYATAYTTAITTATTFATIRTAVLGSSQSTTVAFDGLGRASTRTGQDGTVTSYEYDTAGRLVKETAASGTTEARTLTSRYNAFGEVTGRLLGEASARITAGMTTAQITAIYDQYGLTWSYDAAGRQVSVRDAFGNKTVTYYDEAGRVTHVVNALGEVKESLYNAFGEVKEQTAITSRLSAANTTGLTGGLLTTPVKNLVAAIKVAANDNKTTYAYDKRGLLTSTTDALGFLTSYAYNVHGERSGTTRTIASGNTVTESLSYSKRGELKSRTEDVGGLNRTTSINYDAFGRVTSQVDGRGLTTTTIYDLNGRKITVRDPLNNNRSQTFDAWGRVLSETDALGQTTNYSYNDSTRTLTVSTPDGVSISSTRNRHGEVITATDGKGQSTTYTYNKDGQLLTVKNALNQTTTTNAYDNAGRLLTVKDALNNTTTYGYDAVSRVVSRTDALGTVTSYVFDGQGRQTTVTEAVGKPEQRVTAYSYDRTGQVLTVTQDPSGLALRTTYSYDGLGRQVQVAQGTTASPNQRITKYTFDKLGRRTREQVDPSGLNISTEYRYNGNDQVTRKIDARGNSTWYVYDNAGRLTDTIDALGAVTRNVYDANGRITRTTRYAAELPAATLTTLASTDVSSSVSPTPNVARDQVTTYVYDTVGRLTSETQDPAGLNLVTGYKYDANGRLTRKIDARGNSTWYVYDNAGRLTDTVDALGSLTRNTYDAAGNVTSVTRYATAVATGSFGDVVASVTAPALTNAQRTFYLYDSVGRVRYTIQSLSTGEAVTETIYDANGRVTESRQYDKAITANTTRTLAATATALTTAGAVAISTTYVYDNAGRLTSTTDALNKTESYTYDALGNRKTLKNKNNAVWTYNYDALGRLTEEITPQLSVASITAAGVVSANNRYLVTTIGYDALGNVTSRVEGRQRAAVANAASSDDLSQARTTTYGYDKVGRQTLITSPGWYNKSTGAFQQASDGTANTFQVTTEVSYDALGNATRNRVRVSNTGTVATDYVDSYKTYDAVGRVVHEIDALNGVTAYTYDKLGNALTIKRHANALNFAVPALGYYLASDITTARLVPDAANDRTLTMTYDLVGRKTSVQQDQVSLYTSTGGIDPSPTVMASPTTVYYYNALGQLTREVQEARNSNGATVQTGTSKTYYYDVAGNQVGLITGVPGSLGYYTKSEYNALGQLTRQIEYAKALASIWVESAAPGISTDAKDRSTAYAYDSLGRLTSVTQENVTYWKYNISGSLYTSATLQADQVTGDLVVSRSAYDDVGNVLIHWDAAENITAMGYNALGQMILLAEPARQVAMSGRVSPFEASTVYAVTAFVLTDYAVNAFGQTVSEKRSPGTGQAGWVQTTKTRYDAAGHEIQHINAANAVTDYQVDVAGRRIESRQQVSAQFNAWTGKSGYSQVLRQRYGYDALGRQLFTQDMYFTPTGEAFSSKAVLYNAFGEVYTELGLGYQPTGGASIVQQMLYTYDQAGHVVRQQGAQGITVLDYDLAGQVTRSTQLGSGNPATFPDRVTQTVYNAVGQATLQLLPQFEAVTAVNTLGAGTPAMTTPTLMQTYDRWGNVLSRTDLRGYVTTYAYDHANRQISETLPVTTILRENGTSYSASLIHERRYDALGNLLHEVDLVGPYQGSNTATVLRTRSHAYNAIGELIRDVDALGHSRYYVVDANGNRVATRDALGTVTLATYDVMDRQITHGMMIKNSNNVLEHVVLQTNKYDQAGRRYAEINGTTEVKETFTADRKYVANRGTVRYSVFDERGNVVHTRNESDVERLYEYDEQNRKSKETQLFKSIYVSDKTMTWTYNNALYGVLTGHKDLGDRQFSYSYNVYGQLAMESVNGVSALNKTYEYYSNGLLKSITEGVRNITNSARQEKRTSTYIYDKAGNRIRETDTISVTSVTTPTTSFQSSSAETWYQYDAQGRLTGVYAPLGNRNLVGLPDSSTSNYTLVNGARINFLSYSYDELGNRRRTIFNSTDQSGLSTYSDRWYTYDKEGRVLLGEAVRINGSLQYTWQNGESVGYENEYNAIGQLVSTYTNKGTGTYTLNNQTLTGSIYSRDIYFYDAYGHLTDLNSRYLTKGSNDAWQVPVWVYGSVTGSEWAENTLLTRMRATYDAYGNLAAHVTRTFNPNGTEKVLTGTGWSYRGDGKAIYQVALDEINGGLQLTTLNDEGMIDGQGNQFFYRIEFTGGAQQFTNTYSTFYAYFDTAKELTTTVSSTRPGFKSGTTTYSYTQRGELMQVAATGGTPFTRKFASNREGLLTARHEVGANKTQNYVYHQGAELATYGNASKAELSTAYAPIWQHDNPVGQQSSYSANQGDTLASVARLIWGDARMWYLIADANGLGLGANDTLEAGQMLKIPAVAGSVQNNATTFKPYNPGEVIGDTMPNPAPPPPPKPKKKKCGGLAGIVMAVVAVAATVLTAGAAAPLVAAAGAYGTAAGVAAGLAAAGVAGAVGSAAAQLSGMAMGVVDEFSWRQVAAGGLREAMTFGLGHLVSSASWAKTAADVLQKSNYVGYAARGVFNYATSQAVNRIAGLQTTFSWSGLAASVVGENIAGYAGNSSLLNGVSGLSGDILRGQVSAHATAVVNDKWFGGGPVDYVQVAYDAFGNTMANHVLNSLKPTVSGPDSAQSSRSDIDAALDIGAGLGGRLRQYDDERYRADLRFELELDAWDRRAAAGEYGSIFEYDGPIIANNDVMITRTHGSVNPHTGEPDFLTLSSQWRDREAALARLYGPQMIATTDREITMQRTKQSYGRSLTGDAFLDRQVPSMQIAITTIGGYGVFSHVMRGGYFLGSSLGGTFDAIGQYSRNGSVRLEQTAFAALSGGITAKMSNGRLVVDSVLGGANGALNAGFQNYFYNENNSVGDAAVLGAFFSSVGNGVSRYMSFPMSKSPAYLNYINLSSGRRTSQGRDAVGIVIGNIPSVAPAIEEKK